MKRPDRLRCPLPSWQVRFLGCVAIFMGLWFLSSIVVSWLSYKSVVLKPEPLGLSQLVQIAGVLLYLVCGVGLLRYRNWARYLFIALMVWLLPYICKCYIVFAYRLLHGGVFVWWYEILASLVLATGVLPFYAIWTLTRSNVKKLFISDKGRTENRGRK